jgi:DNA-binding winged helix-turn-helix (wHTH) protein
MIILRTSQPENPNRVGTADVMFSRSVELNAASEGYEFGPFQLISGERQLLREGKPVPITHKAFETLLVLVGRSGHLVQKSELFASVWKDSYVEEGNLPVTISMIRRALGDSCKDQKYIQTIAKRGYRFVAVTKALNDTAACRA